MWVFFWPSKNLYVKSVLKINQKVSVSSLKPNKCRNVNNHHLYALDSNYSIILSLPRKKQARSYYGKNLNTARTYEWIYEPSRLHLLKGSKNELEGIQGILTKANNNPVSLRARDTRPQAARTSQVHIFELGPKIFEINEFI